MSSNALGEMVPMSIPPSSSCFDQRHQYYKVPEYSCDPDMICHMCAEGADNLERFIKSPCRCGFKICTSCLSQVIMYHGGMCPGCGEVGMMETQDVAFGFNINGFSTNVECSGQSMGRSRRSTYDFDNRTIDERVPHSYGSDAKFIDISPPRHMAGPYPTMKARSHSFSSIQGANSQGKSATRKTLQNLRVIQRNLVYVIGLSPKITATEAASPPYFGQYGRIVKVVMNHHHGVSEDDPRHGSASAYVTFQYKEDAWSAIKAVDGYWLEDRHIRASFGTTKYCNSFLRNITCDNPDCLYLHELGDERDRFTKEEIQAGLARHGSSFAFRDEFKGSGSTFDRPSGTGAYTACPVLPPAAPLIESRTIYRSPALDGGCHCCTPKQTLQRHPSGGRLDWSPHHVVGPDVYVHSDNSRGTIPSRSRVPGYPPIQRPCDPMIHIGNDEAPRNNLALYSRAGKPTMQLNTSPPLGFLQPISIDLDKGQSALLPTSKDSVFSTRSNSSLSTRSLSDNSIGKSNLPNDVPNNARKSTVSECSTTSVGESSAGNSRITSPCGPSGIVSGLASIWTVPNDLNSFNVSTISSVASSRPPSISESPLGKRISASAGSAPWQAASTSREMGSLWGRSNSGNSQFWGAAIPSPHGQVLSLPEDHIRSQSWCAEEERNGLPPPHPNRPSSLSYHHQSDLPAPRNFVPQNVAVKGKTDISISDDQLKQSDHSFFSDLWHRWDSHIPPLRSFPFQLSGGRPNDRNLTVDIDHATEQLSGLFFDEPKSIAEKVVACVPPSSLAQEQPQRTGELAACLSAARI